MNVSNHSGSEAVVSRFPNTLTKSVLHKKKNSPSSLKTVHPIAVDQKSTATYHQQLIQWLMRMAKIHDAEIKSPVSQALIRLHADELIEQSHANLHTIQEIEKIACSPAMKKKISLSAHLALKLAHSKLLINTINDSTKFAFVIPVYQEDVRMLPNRPTEKTYKKAHLDGEGFVLEKYRQMSWLFKDNARVAWHLYYVDDGCDRQSGNKIVRYIKALNISKQCEVIKLKDALTDPALTTVLQEFGSEKESKKAGAVYAGMQLAINRGADVIAYSDADLSYDLGLSGFLLFPITSNQTDVVTAHRGHELSIIQKQDRVIHKSYFEEGKLRMKTLLSIFRHELFGHLLPPDTQPGFKAFRSSSVAQVLVLPGKEKGFSFDMQLLARLSYMGKKIQVCPIVCLDSSTHSTADTEKTYFDMLATLTRIASDIRVEKTSLIKLLGDITDTKGQDRARVWSELLILLGSSEERLRTMPGYDIDLVMQIQNELAANGNNTALTKPYSKEIFTNVASLVSQIKTVVS